MKYYSFEKILENIKGNSWVEYKEDRMINTTGIVSEIDRQCKVLKIQSNGVKKMDDCLELCWTDEDEELNGIEKGDFVEVVFSVNGNNECELMVLKKLG